MQLDRQLTDHAERALRADQQVREVVAGRRLAGPRARAHDLAAGGDDRERQHVLAHGPVAHRGRAARACRGHAAERGVGTRIDREEDTVFAQALLELPARDTRLDRRVEVLGAHGNDAIHACQVDRDATLQRSDVALKRGTGTERNHRHAPRVAFAHDRRDLLGRTGEDDEVWPCRLVPRLVVAMAL